MKMLEKKEMVWSSAGVEIAEIVLKMVTSRIKMVLQIHVFLGLPVFQILAMSSDEFRM